MELYVSSPKMTIWVKTENDTIIDIATIGKKFIGQPIDNLYRWMKKHGEDGLGGLKVETI